MTEIKGILLVPEEGDPRGLLKLGPCYARPPMAFVWDGRYLRLPEDDGRWQACCPSWPKPGDALVLAWDGKPVEEGIDRGKRAASRAWLEHLVGCALGRLTDDVDALLDPDLPGTLVLIDAEGREVKNK
tara:strand:- start:91 stop:477 length:387 start_codon:yes stop_codon:yes gene_type:complete